MDMTVRDLRITEVKLPSTLEAWIDKDIEQSEQEIADGNFMEAHEAHRQIMEELHSV